MLLAAHCGPAGFTAIDSDGQRYRGSYLTPMPVHLQEDSGTRSPAMRQRPNYRLDRQADSRFDPARMSDAEREALLDTEVFNDSARVELTMHRWSCWIDSLGRLHGMNWKAIDVRDANNDPVILAAWDAVSRLPVSGESPRWQMPEPILSPEYVACQELADAWREAAGIETTRDAALRFVAQQSARMAEAIEDARQERATSGEAIDPYDLFAMADSCGSILQAAGIAAKAFHLLARCGS